MQSSVDMSRFNFIPTSSLIPEAGYLREMYFVRPASLLYSKISECPEIFTVLSASKNENQNKQGKHRSNAPFPPLEKGDPFLFSISSFKGMLLGLI